MDAKLEEKYCNSMLVVITREKEFPEFAHPKMDELLCSLLEELGYKNIVKIYKSTEKWYE